MELLQLKYFREAARTKNFSHTARKFFVPPSAVSQSIKRLENELGVTLFTRTNNKIALNESGKILYNQVQIALEAIDEGVNKIKIFNSDVKDSVSILIETNRTYLTDCITKFKAMYPHTEFTIYHQRPNDNPDLMFDLIITNAALHYKNYEKIPIIRERILLAVPKSHALAKQTSVNLDTLINEPIVITQPNSRLYTLLFQIFRPTKLQPNITISCDDSNQVRKYVAQGFGITLFPEFSWKSYMDKNIVLIPFSPASPEQVTYLYHKIDLDNINKTADLLKEFITINSDMNHLYNK